MEGSEIGIGRMRFGLVPGWAKGTHAEVRKKFGHTRIEREHYQKLIGRQILAIYWDEMKGKALPILDLSGRDLNGHAATAALLAAPEGNAPGHLDHHL